MRARCIRERQIGDDLYVAGETYELTEARGRYVALGFFEPVEEEVAVKKPRKPKARTRKTGWPTDRGTTIHIDGTEV